MSEEDSQDRDGLEKHYELILLGTGLVQSILSCVASKHGIKVLHLDKNDYYGEAYSSNNLSSHKAHYEKLRARNEDTAPTAQQDCVEGVSVSLIEHDDVFVVDIKNIMGAEVQAAAPRRPSNSSKAHPACWGYAMEVASAAEEQQDRTHPVFRNYVKHNHLTPARVLLQDRDFNIDTTAKVLYGSGAITQLLITSGVANYLEFQSFEGLYFWLDQASAGRASEVHRQLWKVPCSKNDVFNTSVLGALEKRALMKFHLFVADYGRTSGGTDNSSLNENELAVGRSLYRPQNKQQSHGYDLRAYEDKPIQQFLDSSKMSPKLQQIVVYALCCHTRPLSGAGGPAPYLTRDALRDMFLHVDSIGRFGETAFLAPVYGTSEIIQAFCRMSAVWGGTFILRRSVTSLQLAGQARESAGADEGSTDAPASGGGAREGGRVCVASITDSTGKQISCDHFVCGASYWPRVRTQSVLKALCTSLWIGSPLPSSRSIIIIPPFSGRDAVGRADSGAGTLNNAFAIHIIQTDASTNAAPAGAVCFHISTMVPRPDSADWRQAAQGTAAATRELMEKAVALVRASFLSGCAQEPVEISRVVTLQPIYETSPGSGVGELPANVRLCAESDASFSMHAAHDDARDIFQQLFPGRDFTLERQERADVSANAGRGAEDDEDAYLEFALSAIAPLPPPGEGQGEADASAAPTEDAQSS
ncbi:GDP dissociation inhibitor-domain-containing protein [Ochromonadaceae sp. CCMP2298]|nr:GDP dissociation inhibitor-domain-containing protein [Ochromonadaceae sp. CCMP2298]